jgi:hypothetical protein
MDTARSPTATIVTVTLTKYFQPFGIPELRNSDTTAGETTSLRRQRP